MSRLCLSACHVFLFSLSLTYVYIPVSHADSQRVTDSCRRASQMQQRAYQNTLHQETTYSPAYLRLQTSRLKTPLGRLHLSCPALPEPGGNSRANPLVERNWCSRVEAFVPAHRFAVTLQKSSLVRDANAKNIAFRTGRLGVSICSRVPLKASRFDGLHFLCDNYTGLRSISHQCVSERGSCSRTESLSSSQQLTGSNRDLVSCGRCSLLSPCECAVTSVVARDIEQSNTTEEEKKSASQAFSAPVCPPGSACSAEFADAPWSESAAESLLSILGKSSTRAPTDSLVHGVAGNVFPSFVRHTRDSASRGVEIIPGASHLRLDVFLTKCTGVSRTTAAVYLIKGRHVWVNESLCVVPSRRLHLGDRVTCVLTCSCEDKTLEETENAETTDETSRGSRSVSRSRLLIRNNGRQQALQYEILPNTRCSLGKTVWTQLNGSPSILPEEDKTCDTSRLLACSAGRAGIKDEGNASTRKNSKSFSDESTVLTPGARKQSVHVDKPSGNGESHQAALKASVYCSILRSNTDANKTNTQQKLGRLGSLKPLHLAPDERPIQILYEDDYILVLNKPANVLTHPPELNIRNIAYYNAAGSVVHRLLHYFQSSKRSVPEAFSMLERSSVFGPILPKHSQFQLPADARSDVERICGEKAYTVQHLEHHKTKPSERTAFFERIIRVPPCVSRPEGIVHRLDYGTTGVLLVAKTYAAATALREQWKRREVLKGYVGVCSPELKTRQEISAPIKRHHLDRGRMHAVDSPTISVPLQVKCSVRSNAKSNLDCSADVAERNETERSARANTVKQASTIFFPVGGNSTWGLVAAVALTGRTHQVRAHLEYAGHPLVGDTIYGQLPRKTKKRRFMKGKQRSLTSPCCARQAEVEMSMELSRFLRKKTHSLTIPRQSDIPSGTADDVVESGHDGGGVYAYFEKCIRNSQGQTSFTNRPLLHAYLLRIRHPVTGSYHQFKAPLPSDMERIAQCLKPDWRTKLDRIFNDGVRVASANV